MAGGQVPIADQVVSELTDAIVHRFLIVMHETGPGKNLC